LGDIGDISTLYRVDIAPRGVVGLSRLMSGVAERLLAMGRLAKAMQLLQERHQGLICFIWPKIC
jgi:hypothetical protein